MYRVIPCQCSNNTIGRWVTWLLWHSSRWHTGMPMWLQLCFCTCAQTIKLVVWIGPGCQIAHLPSSLSLSQSPKLSGHKRGKLSYREDILMDIEATKKGAQRSCQELPMQAEQEMHHRIAGVIVKLSPTYPATELYSLNQLHCDSQSHQ